MSLDAGRVGVRADQVDIHGRVTSPSFLNELLEDLPEWTDMPVWVNGTEELLPSNNSVPVTSPILADISYPDIRRDNQYFTYRESPTPVDGLAKIKSIKGNTLVWNQLVGTNVNGLSTIQGTTFSLNSNGSIHVTGTGTGNHFCEWRTLENPSFIMKKGHKYLVKFEGLTTGIIAQVSVYTSQSIYLVNKTDYVGAYSEIITPTQDDITSSLVRFYATSTFSGTTDIIMQLFDLTQMGLDITDPSEFTSLFPLSYYSYNQGSLLSFNGTGIKTVGFNQWDEEWEVGNINPTNGSNVSGTDRIRSKNYIPLVKGESYFFKGNANLRFYDGNKTFIGTGQVSSSLLSIPDNASYLRFICFPTYGQVYKNDICVNISNTELNGTYEPYTSSTLSLPVSTYFPTGMKSAGNAYDELTPTKAITRVGAVDMGTLNWGYVAADRRFIAIVSDAKSSSNLTVLENIVSAKYENATWENILTQAKDKIMALHYTSNNSYVAVIDNDYTDAVAFKTAMSGVYLYYELATPVELPTLSLGD